MTDGRQPVVSWDLDGTLYDLDALRDEVRRRIARSVRPGTWRRARAAGQALRRHRRHEQRVRGAGGTVDSEAAAFWAGELWHSFGTQFLLPALRALGPYPGAVSGLARAREAGMRCVVVSDHAVEAKLEALGLVSQFDAVFSGTGIGALKPNPAVFVHVNAALGPDAVWVAHVGDRADTDGAAAALAGIRFCHVVQGDFVPLERMLQP